MFKNKCSFLKVLKINFKLNWNIFLMFTFFWILLSLILPLILGTNFISNYFIKRPSGGSIGFGLSTLIILFYGIIGVSLFQIYVLIILSRNVNFEYKNGGSFFFHMLPISRNNILFGKIMFLYLTEALLIIFTSIIIIICGSFAYDSENLKYLIQYFLQFLVLVLLLTTIFILISFFLLDKTTTFITICSLIIFWMLITIIFSTYSDFNWEYNYGFIKIIRIISYFSPAKLLINTIIFKEPSLREGVNIGEHIKNYKDWVIALLNIIEISLIFGGLYLTTYIFKNKDLNI